MYIELLTRGNIAQILRVLIILEKRSIVGDGGNKFSKGRHSFLALKASKQY